MKHRNVFLVGIDVDSMGGSQRVLHTLAQGFAGRGHRVELVGIRPSPEPHTYVADPGYRHTTLYPEPSPRPWRPATFAERLNPSRIREQRARAEHREAAVEKLNARFADVPHGYVIIGSPWAADWLRAVRRPHLKGVGQYHESYEQARASANLRLILRHYPELEKSVFLSEGDAARFRRDRLPNAATIPNPLPFSPGPAARLDTRRIGAVGRLEPVKRLDRLIDAFADTGERDWELHLFGDGPLRDTLAEHARSRGVAERVHFRGSVGDMAAAYRELSLLALTSDREGRPMAVAEAAACGVPTVSFDLSAGVRELIRDGHTGTLVPPGNTDAFAQALTALMRDTPRRHHYGAAARTHVSGLDLPRILDRWESLFEEIDR
ncbi:glycosyltransferase [Streptomyces harbinensis]|uniref:D-inositol 3-phosphate glycosyltransferase n=1 Tax=Streptomyces harbinensis TaxID=1176198 RepID=A0A1I6UWS1_9ACTN|nr:glycosyltransferase [Streptomyces harbinensis]SFT05863.1 Glycosyltransferase involved in cell wall bisynthesis [Streptomyces harbinensis]